MQSNIEDASGPWVLIDHNDAVEEVVSTAREVVAFIDRQRAAGLGFDIDTMEHRCGECGEETALDSPHAPSCLNGDAVSHELTLGDVVYHLDEQIKLFRAGGEQAGGAAEEIATGVERLLDLLQPRSVDDNTTAVTIDQVDIHVQTINGSTIVSVGTEETPDERTVFVRDWSGIDWEQQIKG